MCVGFLRFHFIPIKENFFFAYQESIWWKWDFDFIIPKKMNPCLPKKTVNVVTLIIIVLILIIYSIVVL